MTGKRKREASDDDAPGSSWPPPPMRGVGNYNEDSLSDETEGGFPRALFITSSSSCSWTLVCVKT
jgi:hypothetical protein